MEEEEEEAIFRPFEQNQHVQVAVQEHCGGLDAVEGGMVRSSAPFETLVMIVTRQEQLIHKSTMEHSERNSLQPLGGQAQPSLQQSNNNNNSPENAMHQEGSFSNKLPCNIDFEIYISNDLNKTTNLHAKWHIIADSTSSSPCPRVDAGVEVSDRKSAPAHLQVQLRREEHHASCARVDLVARKGRILEKAPLGKTARGGHMGDCRQIGIQKFMVHLHQVRIQT